MANNKPISSDVEAIERHRYLEILHTFTSNQAPLTSVADICWNIAKTAIAELGFLDCVVYLLKEDGKTLEQMAAHGPKNPSERQIFNPIEIRLGEGVVGHVAQTGEVQLIRDTRKDPRYITDDDFRLSELAVPIMHGGRTIGVLDSEHPEADFFSDEDVKLFTTIASLASTRIETAIAVDRLEGTIRTLNEAQAKLKSQARDLTIARNKAELASEAKSSFLANMSHEIRTPMTAMVGFADLLTTGKGEKSQREQWRKRLVASSHHLQELIGNVLDVAAVESGKVSAQPRAVDLRELLRDSIGLLRARAESKNLTLTLFSAMDVPSIIEVDPTKLTQVVANLVSNAIKYTEAGSVSVVISADQQHEHCQLTIEVSDTGIGMTPEQLQRAFEPFTRVHETDHMPNIEGTGLGLSLVSHFVELLGGDMKAQSVVGQGSVFTLSLRVSVPKGTRWLAIDTTTPEADPTDEPSLKANIDLTGMRFLFCEDSASIAEIVVTVLAQKGAVVEHFTNGLLGVQRYQEITALGESFDLIIMDMQMPVMDGYQAAGQLKALGVSCPILALTAQAIKEDKSRCLAAGCDFYLSKPIDLARFTKQIYNMTKTF